MNKVLTIFLLVLLVLSGPAQARDSLLDIKEVTSDGGIKAWLVEDHSIPVISIQFGFKNAGSYQDPAEKQGLAQLASNTLDEGAGDLGSQEFQKKLRDLSIDLRFQSGRDHFVGSLKTLSRNKEEAYTLTKLAVTQPRFDEEAVERMRAANQSRIRSALSDPSWMAARLVNDKAYEGHPYAQNSGGTLSTLADITPADLKAFAKARLGKNNLYVAAAGDITKEELKQVIDQVFGSLPDVSLPEAEDIQIRNQGDTYLYKQEIPQTIIEITQQGISREDPDIFTAHVMNYILGGSGFGSRLMEEVREKRGLSYGIYTGFDHLNHADVYSVSTSTATDNVDEVLSLIAQEWTKMTSEPVTEEELESAKAYLIGSLPLSLTSTDNISGLLLRLQINDLPIDYLDIREKGIKKASAKDVQTLAKRLLNHENFLTILVGQPENMDGDEIIEALPNVE